MLFRSVLAAVHASTLGGRVLQSPLSLPAAPASDSGPTRPPPPSDEEDRRKAQQVVSHAGMLRILCDAMLGNGWGTCDRIDCQCVQESSHAHWTRSLEALRMPGVSIADQGRNKRRRMEENSQHDAASV